MRSRRLPVVVDVMVAGRAVKERLVTVAARSSTTLQMAQLSAAPSAAVAIQPLGGAVVVEQGYSVNGDVAMAPCATRASGSWFFAAGSSVGGALQSLSLFDPFAVDAVVDVEGFTENGLRAPGSLQGIVVPHQSRLAVRIDRAIAQQNLVAIFVRVRTGARIVADQIVTRARSKTSTNTSLSLGATQAGSTWMFADNRSRAGAAQRLVIANPGETDAKARVSIVADVDAVIEPRVVQVPAGAAVAVDFAGVVPPGVNYTLVVRSPVPVVAETRDTFAPGRSELTGLVTEVGSPVASNRWWFAGGPFAATGVGGGGPRVPGAFDQTVVMKAGATVAEISDVHSALLRDGHIVRFTTVSRSAAKRAYLQANRDNPSLIANASEATMQMSFNLVVKSQSFLTLLHNRYASRAGVAAVISVAGQAPPVTDDVVVLNPGTRPVRVTVVASAAGSILRGAGMRDVVVSPGDQVTISLVGLAGKNAAAVVTASGPVVAERFTGGTLSATRSPGVPAA